MFKFLLKLDFNVIGIITSFINNDFYFLYYLKENNCRPYYKEIEWNHVDWENISSNIEKYDIKIVDEFKDHFNWDSITTRKINDQEFLTKYNELVNFELINQKMRFSYTIEYSFYSQFEDKFDWVRLSRWADMAEDFIDMYHDKLDWGVLCRAQGLTEYIMNKYYDKLILEDIRANYHIEQRLKDNILRRMNNDINNEEESKENEEEQEINEEENNFIGPENNQENINNEQEEDIDIEMNTINNENIYNLLNSIEFNISDNIPREDIDIDQDNQ